MSSSGTPASDMSATKLWGDGSAPVRPSPPTGKGAPLRAPAGADTRARSGRVTGRRRHVQPTSLPRPAASHEIEDETSRARTQQAQPLGGVVVPPAALSIGGRQRLVCVAHAARCGIGPPPLARACASVLFGAADARNCCGRWGCGRCPLVVGLHHWASSRRAMTPRSDQGRHRRQGRQGIRGFFVE